jgi:hypothetical protein
MDDFLISSLEESKNEWCIRLCNVLTPHILEGIRSLFNEAVTMCEQTKEPNKYLMTFQNLLTRVPNWNAVIVEEEKKRILEKSGCHYMEDLITCVQIIQLKCLTCIRVGNKQKKIDLVTLKLDLFLHKVYIHVARELYSNTYLFEKGISPLQYQRNRKDIELCIRQCIMNVVRESIPTEQIIMAYLDETVEEEEEVTIETVSQEEVEPVPVSEPTLETEPVQLPSIQNLDDKPVVTRLTFNDVDFMMDEDGKETEINAPKSLERLEEMSSSKSLLQRAQRMDEEEEDENVRLEPIDIDIQPMSISLDDEIECL